MNIKNNNLYLNILPKEQQELWENLKTTPNHFTLYGGTAIALQLGHRQSIDFDFFSKENFEPLNLYKQIDYLVGSKIIQNTKNTLTCEVNIKDKPVQVSFFGDIDFVNKINRPVVANNNIKIASLEDVGATKMATVYQRVSVKDYLDIHALLKNGYKISNLLRNADKLYGSQFNASISIKSLLDLNNKELIELNKDVKNDLQKYINDFINKKIKSKDNER